MSDLLMLVALLSCATFNVVVGSSCDPSRFLCSGVCPPFPGVGGSLKPGEAVCSRDPDSDTCVCWLHNPHEQLHTLFQCEAKINGSLSKVACYPPSDCFQPDPNIGCLIILQCQCLLIDHRHHDREDEWKRVKAMVHTMKKTNDNQDGFPIEKVEDIREFSLKHLLFLLGFVIAPLLCWCLLNFFHDGKCRKKPLPPEAQPMPTTLDGANSGDEADASPSRAASCAVQMPSAPDPEDAATEEQQEAFLKCESPPPYCESTDRRCATDCGPPPTYEDAVRGSDLNAQQLWQTAFVLQPQVGENT